MKSPSAFLHKISISQIQFDIFVHGGTLDIVESEHVGDGKQRPQSESFSDRRLWTTGDEEFGLRDLVHVAREHRKERRRGFLVLALVEGIDNDEGRDLSFFERAN